MSDSKIPFLIPPKTYLPIDVKNLRKSSTLIQLKTKGYYFKTIFSFPSSLPYFVSSFLPTDNTYLLTSDRLCVCVCVCVLVAQSCPTLWNPLDCSSWGSSVHGIRQARIMEWVAMPFSRASSRPRDRTQIFHIAGRLFTIWTTREAPGLTILVTKADTKIRWLAAHAFGKYTVKRGMQMLKT